MTTLQLVIDASKARSGAAEFTAATNSVRSAGREADKSVRQLQSGMNGLTSTTRSIIGGFTQIQSLFLGLAGAAIGVHQAVKAITSFEETMAKVGAVSGASAEDLRRLTDQAREMGVVTRFSASEAAGGQELLAQAGLNAQQVMSALPATLSLAAAAGLQMSEAAEIASSSMSQFGLGAGEVARIADVLVLASQRSNSNVRELGDALSYVGPVASSLGISLEQTSAALGTLANAGIKGSRAGTALQRVLSVLSTNVTSEAQAAFEKLGLRIDDLRPQTNSLSSIFGKLRDSGFGSAEAFAIFGERAGEALKLVQQVDTINQLESQLRGASGAARDAAAAMDNTLAGSFRALASATEGLFIALGDAGLKGILRGIIDTMTGVIRVMVGSKAEIVGNAAVVEAFKAQWTALKQVVSAAGESLRYAASQLAAFFQSSPLLRSLSDGLKNTIGSSSALATSFEVLTGAMVGLGVAKVITGFAGLTEAILGAATASRGLFLVLAANPIGLIATALGAAAAAAYYYRDSLVSVRSETNALEESQVSLGSVAQATLETLASRFGQTFSFMVEELPKLGQSVVDWLNGFKDDWGQTFEGIGGGVKTFINGALGLFRGLLTSVGELLSRLYKAATAFAQFDWQKPLESAKAIGSTIAESFDAPAISDQISSNFKAAFETDFVGAAFELGKAWGEDLVAGAEDSGVKDWAKDLLNTESFRSEVARRSVQNQRSRESWDFMRQGEAALEDFQSFLQNGSAFDPNPLRATLPEEPAKNLAKALEETTASAKAATRSTLGLASATSSASSSIAASVETTRRMVNGGPADQQEGSGLGSFLAPFLSKSLSKLLFADGAAFQSGRVVPFASGALVTTPTSFPMAGGETGLMGEAGPEAIMPLTRDRNGRLGVRTSGSSPAPQTTVNNYRINVQTPDADSFRRSQRQLESRTRRGF